MLDIKHALPSVFNGGDDPEGAAAALQSTDFSQAERTAMEAQTR